jgi:hypothetical protein
VVEKILIRDEKNSDAGSGMGKIRIRDGKNSDPGWKQFGSGVRDGKNSDPAWKKFGIRDEKKIGSGIKQPGSATH